jgi:CBS domain-containing protein
VSDARAFRARAAAAADLTLADVVRPAPTMDIHASLLAAAELMTTRQLSHLGVTRRGKLVGILRPEDLYQPVGAGRRRARARSPVGQS